jgi:hypothetical protein
MPIFVGVLMSVHLGFVAVFMAVMAMSFRLVPVLMFMPVFLAPGLSSFIIVPPANR